MNKQLISEIANEIVNQTIYENYKFYLILLNLVIITSAVSFFAGSYLKRRGENYATKQDFEDILSQVKKTTTATEEIRTKIVAEHSQEEDKRKTTRDKLEKIFHATYNLELWLEQTRSQSLDGAVFHINSSPLAEIELLQCLYFPECSEELNALDRATHSMIEWLLEINQLAFDAKNKGDYSGVNTAKFPDLHKPVRSAILDFRAGLIAKYANN